MRKKSPTEMSSASPTNAYKPFVVEPRTATPRSLRQSTIDELLLLAISGGEDPTIAGAIEANARELEVLYRHFTLNDDPWAASIINTVQQRMRVLAEVARRRELGGSGGSLRSSPEPKVPQGGLDLVKEVSPLGGL